MALENWTNVSLQDNTFTNNDKYDYNTACTTGTFATMKKYVDAGMIQSYTNEDRAMYYADCSVYGNLVNT